VAANAEVVAVVVEDADIIICSFIKVMDISPSITILMAILAVSEKPNALSLRWPISTISALWPAGRNFAEIARSIEQILAKQAAEIAAASITGSPVGDASSVQAAKTIDDG
jgi:hypothetical protein